MTLKKALEIVDQMSIDKTLREEQRDALNQVSCALETKREYQVVVRATIEVSDVVTVCASSPEDAAQVAAREFERDCNDKDFFGYTETFKVDKIAAIKAAAVTLAVEEDSASV